MKLFNLKHLNSSKFNFNKSPLFTNFLRNNSYKFSSKPSDSADINLKQEDNYHYPIKGFPSFANRTYTVFENTPIPGKFPLMPWEVKECCLKGWIYTFFLMWLGRFTGQGLTTYLTQGIFIPNFTAVIFFYQYGRIVHYMANAITSIKLMDNGTHVIFTFKNFRRPVEVEISRIKKIGDAEKVIQESFVEPYLLPIEIDYDDVYGKSSFRARKRYFIYGESHEAIKDGEIFRAIINSQPIKLN